MLLRPGGAGRRKSLHEGRVRAFVVASGLLCCCCFAPCWGAKTVVEQSVPCAAVLGIPKVAILFIARQGLPLEQLWEAWFSGLAGLVPVEPAHDIACLHNNNTQYTDLGSRALNPCLRDTGGPILQRQYLFSVYVHSSRQDGWTDFDPSSVFFGTLLPEKQEAMWGDTTPAVRYLLRTALAEQTNVNFMLLSDSDVPLYPATFVYQQVVHETQSRVASCWPYDLVNINRFTCDMEADGLGIDKWRKSNLWFTLIREHAHLAAYEEFVYGIFRKHCTGTEFDKKLGIHRGCLTDEHFYGTLLAHYNRQKETDCMGMITISDFRNSVKGHPHMYTASEISLPLLEELRRPIWWLPKATCAESVIGEAREAFVSIDELERGIPPDECIRVHFRNVRSFMELHCQLFARKFEPGTAAPLLALMTNASNEVFRLDVPR